MSINVGHARDHQNLYATTIGAEIKYTFSRHQLTGLLLICPAGVLLIALFIAPALYAFYLGFTNLKLIGPTARNFSFNGLTNVQRLFSDPTFYGSILTTLWFVIGSAAGALIIGLLLALAMENGNRIAVTTVGGIVITCWMMPVVSAGMAWYGTSTAGGSLADILGSPNSDFLQSSPLLIIILANIWGQAGFVMLVLAAGLRGVPSEYREAAMVEGATKWQAFWRVTLPAMRPVVTTAGLVSVLLSLANFSLVYIMTQGGPADATNILPVYSYQVGFILQDLAYGALLGDALVVLSIVPAYIYVRASKGQV